MPLFRHPSLLACLALLSACSLTPIAAPPARGPEPQEPPPALEDTHQARQYRLDPASSTLRILVYRGGTMARLGHNHVISSTDLQGRIWLGRTLGTSGFDIRVPVETLIMDDNQARLTEGPDFPLNLSEDAKQGTKANMLRETLLDGARYPEVRIQSLRVEGSPQAPEVVAALRIRNQTRELRLPIQLESNADDLRVRGSFALRQSDFGITPLSLALGALQVQDEVHIRFDLRAVPG